MKLMRVVGLLVLVMALAAPVSAVAIDTSESGVTVEPTIDPPTAEATEQARQVRRELRDLARAWEEGGGRFGYPFWEKAGHRWTDHQITTTMYREYVTGYRDRLRAGCELIDSADIDTSEAKDVRSLVLDACRRRVEALRDQQRWLDELIRRDGTEGSAEADVAEVDARIVELQVEWRAALQESYRDARLAMDLAQDELDGSGLERLPEDAFL